MRLAQELKNVPERTVVCLPANYEAVCHSAIGELEAHLASREASASREAIRTLIEAVIVHEDDARGGKVRRPNFTAISTACWSSREAQ